MLTKIIYKNFRSNLKNYILFFLSNIVAIMELFVFYGIRSIIKNSITDKVTAEALKTDFQIAVGIIAVITLMLMFYAMKCYIKLRIKDYSMFLILGSNQSFREKVMYITQDIEMHKGTIRENIIYDRGELLMNQRKSLKELNLLDKFLFDEAMDDPENVKTMLDIILL